MSDHPKVRSGGKVRKRRRCDSAAPSPTHFFRVMLPCIIQDKKLRIPKKFITRFGDKLSAVITLAVQNGSVCNVKLEKVDNKVYFKDGWHEFVQQHSIREYYFLVFNYGGHSSFDVVIFDLSTTEICYDQEPSHAKQGPSHHEEELEGDDDDDNENDKDDSIEILSSSPPPRFVPKSPEKKADDDNDEDYSIEILSSSTPPCSVPKFMEKKKRARGRCSNPPLPQNLGTSTCAESCLGVEKHGRNAALKNQEIKREYMTRTKRSKVDNLNESSPAPGNLNIETGPDQFKKKKPKTESTEDEQPARNVKEDDSLSTKILPGCFSLKKPKMTQRREEATKAGSMYAPENPTFTTIMRPCNIHNNIVYLEADFARKLPLQVSQFIMLRDLDGREWRVRCIPHDGKGMMISKGWQAFVRGNDLVEGDVCVFERIECSEIVLKVTIFHKRTLGVKKHGQNAASLKNQELKRKYLTRTKRWKMDLLNESSRGNLKIEMDSDQLKMKKPNSELNDQLPRIGSSPPPCFVPKSSEKEYDDDDDNDDHSIEILGSSTQPSLVPKFMERKKQALGGCSYPPPPKNLAEDEQPAQNAKEYESFSTKILSRSFSMKKPKMTQSREEAIKAASMYKPQSPSFMATLRPYNVARCGIVNVPTDFARRCLMQFPKFIKLRHQSDGREWCVRCIHYDVKRWIMSKGWAAFVQENVLDEGDVCVFELVQVAEIVLKVTIFRKRTLGVEKHDQNADSLKNLKHKREYLTRSKWSKMNPLNESSRVGPEIEMDPDQLKKKKRKSEPNDQLARVGKEGGSSTKKLEMTQKREKAIKAASMYKPENPTFIATMQSYNIRKNMYLAADFARKLPMQVSKFIKLRDLDGREWCVRCIGINDKRFMSKGWIAFVQENDLEEGDVCVFELIQGDEIVLKVTIFRKRTLKVVKHGQNAASLKNKKLKHKYLTRSKQSKMDHLNESTRGNLKIEMDPDQFKKKKRKSEPNKDDQLPRIGKERGSSTKKLGTTQRREEAIKAASMYKPENLTFMAIMRSYNIHKGLVYLGADFARKLRVQGSKLIKLRDLDGREWCVRCFRLMLRAAR